MLLEDARKQIRKDLMMALLRRSGYSIVNPSVDYSNCQPSGENGAKAGDASPEPDGSVEGRRSESEGVRDESPKGSSVGSPTTLVAGCKDSRRETIPNLCMNLKDIGGLTYLYCGMCNGRNPNCKTYVPSSRRE